MKTKKKRDWSQLMVLVVILFGFITTQECIGLMLLCILRSYTSTAAWLTAAIGVGEAIIGLGFAAYTSLCKTDHQEGGLTYEKAKASGFKESEVVGSPESPGI